MDRFSITQPFNLKSTDARLHPRGRHRAALRILVASWPFALRAGIVVRVDVDFGAELIDAAQAALRPHRVGSSSFGTVAAVLVTDAGHRFPGVCIDTGSGTGFCAEHSAIAAMVTAGEYRIAAIVAVWRDEQARLYVLPPCGRCREFMRQVDPANLDAIVLLGGRRSALLRDLLPEHDWPEPDMLRDLLPEHDWPEPEPLKPTAASSSTRARQ